MYINRKRRHKRNVTFATNILKRILFDLLIPFESRHSHSVCPSHTEDAVVFFFYKQTKSQEQVGSKNKARPSLGVVDCSSLAAVASRMLAEDNGCIFLDNGPLLVGGNEERAPPWRRPILQLSLLISALRLLLVTTTDDFGNDKLGDGRFERP